MPACGLTNHVKPMSEHGPVRHASGLLAVCCATVVVGAMLSACTSRKDKPVPKYERVVLGPVFTVDRIYESMRGPQRTTTVRLDDTRPDERLWLTRFEARVVAPDGETPQSQEYMCHANVDVGARDYRRRFHVNHTFDGRFFTLSQGQTEIVLPDGFGLPIVGGEPIRVSKQLLNLNELDNPLSVRHRIVLEYARESEAHGRLKPLYQVGLYGMKLVRGDNPYPHESDADSAVHGPGCLPGEPASGHTLKDSNDQTFTGHWVVPPGREENHTLVTKLLNLPFDTTVHYIAAHMHPFGESIRLVDLTEGKTLFESTVRPMTERLGIDHVDYYSSEQGIPLYRDHEYELISVYNNTSDQPRDAMAVLYLYLHDKELEANLKMQDLSEHQGR